VVLRIPSDDHHHFVRHAEKAAEPADDPRRTQETAQPIADALDLPINTYDAADTEAVLGTVLRNHKGKIILVVGHSNTVPVLIANLGASKKVPPIHESEYDNIYIISIPWFGKTKTIRLRFGEPYVASLVE
jgi:broad specificity phosphatase PhoE